MSTLRFALLSYLLLAGAAAIPYSEYILTPKSRIIVPVSVYNVNGTVDNAEALTTNGNGVTTMHGKSAITLDFGKNIAGLCSFNTEYAEEGDAIGISFTESSLWINNETCDATGSYVDLALWFPISTGGYTKFSEEFQRGGFRYLNVYHNSSGSVSISNLTIYYTAIPQVAEEDMGVYTGYFHSDDNQLNRVWYAGAYTAEMCTIDPTAGNALWGLNVLTDYGQYASLAANQSNATTPAVWAPEAWYNNYTITNGTSVLVDGAKRDRLVWPGDLVVEIPTVIVSTYNLESIRNALDSLISLQNKTTGMLPTAGAPFAFLGFASFTYHLHTLIALYDSYLYTGDTTYMQQIWLEYKLAISWALSFVDETGLANVTSVPSDWGRFGLGGYSIEANALLYYTLTISVSLANEANEASTAATWCSIAEKLKAAANQRLWNAASGLYRDNDTLPLTELHPQDGNVWAIIANLTESESQAKIVSEALEARWGPYGAPAPEARDAISPFISSLELKAHYIAKRPASAVKLMKFMWGEFMLDDPRMTNSTFIEGYKTDGNLSYAPYPNDQRISHAHGWATGPTSALTLYAAGLQMTGPGGKVWRFNPSMGGLKQVEAGYRTGLGSFSASLNQTEAGLRVTFSTPLGTTGSASLEYPAGGAVIKLRYEDGSACPKVTTFETPQGMAGRFDITDLPGGPYTIFVKNRVI